MKSLSDHLHPSYCTHSRSIVISSLKSVIYSSSIKPAAKKMRIVVDPVLIVIYTAQLKKKKVTN